MDHLIRLVFVLTCLQLGKYHKHTYSHQHIDKILTTPIYPPFIQIKCNFLPWLSEKFSSTTHAVSKRHTACQPAKTFWSKCLSAFFSCFKTTVCEIFPLPVGYYFWGEQNLAQFNGTFSRCLPLSDKGNNDIFCGIPARKYHCVECLQRIL